MEILGLKLVPNYRRGLDYEVYRDGKLVGFITFVWGYVRVSKYVRSNNSFRDFMKDSAPCLFQLGVTAGVS